MDLLENIRTDRARQRKRERYRVQLFTIVGCIVRDYELGGDFLRSLDSAEGYVFKKQIELVEVKSKRMGEFPPFVLLSQEKYTLVLTITGRVNNPYLRFARTPEELLLSAPLYQANPALDSELLRHWDFETLLRYQRAKDELMVLERRSRTSDEALSQGSKLEEYGWESSHRRIWQERIKQLQTFVARVEKTELQPK